MNELCDFVVFAEKDVVQVTSFWKLFFCAGRLSNALYVPPCQILRSAAKDEDSPRKSDSQWKALSQER